MADYELYYWPVPFRGQFIRAILAYAGRSWDEHDSEEIGRLMRRAPAEAPVGFMGPPVLIDRRSGLSLSQMPAIALYLGDTLGLVADDAAQRAMTAKIVNDANDVIDELTLEGGREMWTTAKWEAFVPRLTRWMAIWEAIAVRHGVTPEAGFLLGTARAGVADIVTATLWSTIAERFAVLRALLEATAPLTAALARRIEAEPSLTALRETTRQRYGQAYCGGQIEASLRAVLQEPL